MNDQAMKFRLGVFVLGAAILLAILIILFGRFPTVLSRPLEYTVRFAEAPGIEQGTVVRKSGVRIGEVQSVDLDPNTGAVTVRIVVDRKYQLRKGDKATLGRNLILGDATVNFLPEERGDREPAPNQFAYQGELPDDIRQYLKDATSLVPTTQLTLEELRETAKTLREFMPEVKRTAQEIQITAANVGRLAETSDNFLRNNQDQLVKAVENLATAAGNTAQALNEENRKNLAATLQNVRRASEDLDNLTKQTQAFLTETQTTVKKVGDRIDEVGKNADGFITETRATVKNVGEQITKVSKNADELITESKRTVQIAGDRIDGVGKQAEEFLKQGQTTVRKVNDTLAKTDEVVTNLQTATRPLAEKAPTVMKNLEETSIRMNQVAYNVADFTRALNQENGTLRKLLADPALYNNVNDAVASLNKSLARFDRVMQDMAIFADKVARRPELLGVSGAVSPSSGIKR